MEPSFSCICLTLKELPQGWSYQTGNQTDVKEQLKATWTLQTTKKKNLFYVLSSLCCNIGLQYLSYNKTTPFSSIRRFCRFFKYTHRTLFSVVIICKTDESAPICTTSTHLKISEVTKDEPITLKLFMHFGAATLHILEVTLEWKDLLEGGFSTQIVMELVHRNIFFRTN